MILTTICSSCKKTLKVKSGAKNRGDLQREMGDNVTITCNSCATVNRKHINRISAEVDNRVIIASIFAGIIISGLAIFYLGLIASLLLSIPIIVWRIEMNNAHDFNSYRIRSS